MHEGKRILIKILEDVVKVLAREVSRTEEVAQ